MRGTKTGGINMKVFRCPNCEKILFKFKLTGYVDLEIKCSRCSKLIVTKLVGSAYVRRKFRKTNLKGD